MKKNGFKVGIIVISVSMLFFGCKNNQSDKKIAELGNNGNFVSLQETQTDNNNSENVFGSSQGIEEENESECKLETLKETEVELEYLQQNYSESERESSKEEEKTEISKETTSQQESEQEKTWTIIEIKKTMYPTIAINIRKGPGTEFEKIGTFSKNQQVTITGKVEETGWYRVRFKNQKAFVSSRYLSETKIEESKEEDKQETNSEIKQETEDKQETNSEIKQETENKQENQESKSWVANLKVAKNAKQIIVVAANGNKAKVSMHNKNTDGNWIEIVNTSGYVGKNGIGKSKEGDKKTPTGQYQFLFAFGIKNNPGTSIRYIQVNDSHYWVDDSNSAYYNQFVSTNDVNKDWNSAEHLIDYKTAYKYALAVNYNSSCKPNAGSAIFLHCSTGSATAGCISVPEKDMINILKNVQSGCVLIIDSTSGVYNY